MRRARSRLIVSLWFLAAASCASPKAEELPQGYRRVERQGVTFYFRPGDEAFVDEVLPVVQEVKPKLGPVVAQLKDSIDQVKVQRRIVRTRGLDGDTGERLFQNVAAKVQATESEREAMRKIWETFVRFMPQMLERSLGATLQILSLDHIRIVTAEEIVQGLVPCLKYRGGPPSYGLRLRVEAWWRISSRRGDSPSPVSEPTAFDLAFPIYRGTLPNGEAWKDSLAGLVAASAVSRDSPGFLGSKEFPLEEVNESVVTFVPLHEAVEYMLFDSLRIRDPLARWFHDGMANYLAEEAIREVLGQEIYDRCSYAPNKRDRFAAAKEQVNLLAWPRGDLEKQGRPTPESPAHYFFATEEIRGLAGRHGKDFIERLLLELRDQKSVDTERICRVVKKMTGDNLMRRLEAYVPAPSGPIGDLEEAADTALEKERFEEALPILEEIVAQYPRDAGRRYSLAMAYLNTDPAHHLSDFLFHCLIYEALTRSRGVAPKDPYLIESRVTAPAMYAVGRFCEEAGYPQNAREYYAKALELDAGHASSQDRLRALDSATKPSGDRAP